MSILMLFITIWLFNYFYGQHLQMQADVAKLKENLRKQQCGD